MIPGDDDPGLLKLIPPLHPRTQTSMSQTPLSLDDTGIQANQDGMSPSPKFITVDDIPAGFVVVNVGDKQLLLPKQFVALFFRYRDDPEAATVCV